MPKPTQVVCPECDAVNRVTDTELRASAKCEECRELLFQAKSLALNARRFERHVTGSDIPLLVDFWAPTCGPCRTLAPAFEAAARCLEPSVRLIKMNADEAHRLATQFGVLSIPMLLLFKNGREAARITGAMGTGRVVTWTREHL
jgi:thioredoxin 2